MAAVASPVRRTALRGEWVARGRSALPWLVGGPVLSALADRLPRHRVLIATDAGRAVLVALMAVPGVPLPALLVLMFVLAMCSPPFESARSALVADVLMQGTGRLTGQPA